VSCLFYYFVTKKNLLTFHSIGPRKLLRVISDVQDSIVTRQPGDYFTHTPIPITPRPRMIRGDSDRPQSPEVAMKFAAHIRPAEVELSRDQILLPTPKSTTMAPLRVIQETGGASREELPSDSPLRRVPDRTLDLSIKRERPPGHTVLLVEDNDINMRVRLSREYSPDFEHMLTTTPVASLGPDGQTRVRLRMRGKRPGGVAEVQSRPVGVLPCSHGHEHAGKFYLLFSSRLGRH
jgi:hypothetical protein